MIERRSNSYIRKLSAISFRFGFGCNLPFLADICVHILCICCRPLSHCLSLTPVNLCCLYVLLRICQSCTIVHVLNHAPISHLSFLSKTSEGLVAVRLIP